MHNNICITGQYLANVTGVTSRTIRGDIKELNAELYEYGIYIQSIAGKGYYIPRDMKSKVGELVSFKQDYVVPILPGSRTEYIIKQLILYPSGVSTEAISNQMYVSKSTLDRDLIMANQELGNEGICLAKKSGNIIYLCGDEISIRNVYIDFFAKFLKTHKLDKIYLNDEINKIFIEIKEIVYKVIKQYEHELTGDEYDAVTVLLAVVIFRNVNGFCLKKFDKETKGNNEFAGKIIDMIYSKVILNQSEKKYINHYIEKFIYRYEKAQYSSRIQIAVESSLEDVKTTYEYIFSSEVKDRLVDLINCRCDINPSEYSLSDIEREYPLAFEMTVSLVNAVKHKIAIDICDEILANIALLFACEMEKNRLEEEQKKRSVVIVCQSGEFIYELIGIKIKRFFSGFNILGYFPLYRIEEALKLKPDIIISTVMVKNDSIPFIVIKSSIQRL